jgi:2-methylcitrate dehydratase PrpD
MGLKAAEMLHTLALAFTEASDTIQSHLDGSLGQRVHNGQAAKEGLESALLAARGITGPHHALEGPSGFYNAHARGEYDRDRVLKDLGREFAIGEVSVKLFPCCKQIHPATDAVLTLVSQHDLHPEDIADIEVRVNRNAYNQVCSPEEIVSKPPTSIDAQWSIPFAAGLAVAKRAVLLSDYTEEGIKNPAALEVASKVRCVLDPEIDRLDAVVSPALVEITTVRGQTFSHRADYARGDPQQPLGFEECVDLKFRNYLSWAAKPIPEPAVEEVIEMVADLEKVEDVSQLVRLLTCRSNAG